MAFGGTRQIHKGKANHDKLLEGVIALEEVVSTTLGPMGRNVILERSYSESKTTKDGVTVAADMFLEDNVANIGMQLVKQVSQNTAKDAGDGPQPLYSKILTPEGFIKMKDVKVGTRICGTNNTIQNVIGVYPKGVKDVYELTTSDGRKMECCEDHLFTVITHYGAVKTLTVKEILKEGIYKEKQGHKQYNFYLPLTSVQFEQNDDLPIDPYLLGILLGDGYFSNTRSSIEISLALDQDWILDKITLPEGCKFSVKKIPEKNYIKVRIIGTKDGKSIIKKLLKPLGLLGIHSDDKFIPKSYLYSNFTNRESLLQGLLDSDGHFNKRGLFEYGTISKQLNKDFIELNRSLGIPIYNYTLERKENDASFGKKPIHRTYQLKGYKNGLKIESIVKTNKSTEMQCIKVDNPDNLYITDDYIVTHNTTTSTLLARHLFEQGLKAINNGEIKPIHLKRELLKLTKEITEEIQANAKQISDDLEYLKSVAYISCNNDEEISALLNDIIDQTKGEGQIIMEDSPSDETYFKVDHGIVLETSYISPAFFEKRNQSEDIFGNMLVAVTNYKIDFYEDIQNWVGRARSEGKGLLIFAEELQGSAKTNIINIIEQIKFPIAVVKTPYNGTMRRKVLEDLAILTGGKFIDRDKGYILADLHKKEDGFFGEIESCKITTDATVLSGYKGNLELIEERKKNIEKLIPTLPDLAVQNRHKQRLSELFSGFVSKIYVGGASDLEKSETKYRVEDAIEAIKSAVSEGVVAGGGSFFAKISKKLEENTSVGAKIMAYTLKQPLLKMLENADMDSSLAEQVACSTDLNYGLDIATGEFTNLLEAKVIDPAKVLRVSLQNAVSVASNLLLTSVTLTYDEKFVRYNNPNVPVKIE